jgi:hypothetical protein
MTAAEVGPADAPTFRAALRSRRLCRLLVAHVAGTIGQQVLTLAVGLHVLDRTSSGLWVSVPARCWRCRWSTGSPGPRSR